MKRIFLFIAFTMTHSIFSMDYAEVRANHSQQDRRLNTELNNKLKTYVFLLNIEKVEKYLKSGANPDLCYEDRVPLLEAFLLTKYSNTELQEKVACKLVEYGANPNHSTREVVHYTGKVWYTMPPIVHAARKNFTTLCKMLLEKGAQADQMILRLADENKNEELSRILQDQYKVPAIDYQKKSNCCDQCSLQ